MVGFKQVILLMFCISICMSLVGYPSAAETMLHSWGNSTVTANGISYGGESGSGQMRGGAGTGPEVQKMVIDIITLLVIVMGVGVGFSTVTGGNFAQIYIIPLAMVPVLLVLALTPMSFLLEPSIPLILRELLGGFIGIIIIIGVMEFIRGGES